MTDLFGHQEIVPARRLAGKVEQVLLAAGSHFVTAPVPSLALTFAGIAGGHHVGLTRGTLAGASRGTRAARKCETSGRSRW